MIIGGPDAGKTHFGGQLYGRLNTKKDRYKIVSPPENLTIFKEVLDSLNEGKSAGHTSVSTHNNLDLEIERTAGEKFVFSFPDYGGEQIRSMVGDRRIDKEWKKQVDESTGWLLMVRLDKILPVEDVVSRGLPEQEVLKTRQAETEPMKLSATAFYIELLQILLFAKKMPTRHQVEFPKLSFVISCWDLLDQDEQGMMPRNVLRKRLPGLWSFISSNWREGYWEVIGLSSTEKSLSLTEPDMDYVKKGPESFGYLITSKGEKESDLTQIIATFLEH